MAAKKNEAKATLKKIVIARRPGFREGVTFRFAGQLTERVTDKQMERYLDGDFDPEPITEVVEMDLEVPPLNFSLLKMLTPQLASLGTNPDPQNVGVMVDILAHALARNYRGVPRWLIEQSLDIANMPALAQAVMDASGLKRKEQLEEKKAMAAANSTGTTSTST